MTPAEVRTMPDHEIVELLVSLKPSDPSVAWLASIIADPTKLAGVNELSRRYAVNRDGRHALPRAKAATSIWIDGSKFKALMWRNRVPLCEIGPAIGKSEGFGSVIAHRGRISYWSADAIATELLGCHVDDFIAQVAAPIELERLDLV